MMLSGHLIFYPSALSCSIVRRSRTILLSPLAMQPWGRYFCPMSVSRLVVFAARTQTQIRLHTHRNPLLQDFLSIEIYTRHRRGSGRSD